jgi:hypothetical protein
MAIVDSASQSSTPSRHPRATIAATGAATQRLRQ